MSSQASPVFHPLQALLLPRAWQAQARVLGLEPSSIIDPKEQSLLCKTCSCESLHLSASSVPGCVRRGREGAGASTRKGCHRAWLAHLVLQPPNPFKSHCTFQNLVIPTPSPFFFLLFFSSSSFLSLTLRQNPRDPLGLGYLKPFVQIESGSADPRSPWPQGAQWETESLEAFPSSLPFLR